MRSLTSVINNFIFILLVLLYVSASFPMGVALVGVSLTKPLVALLVLITMFNYFSVRKNDPMMWFLVALSAYMLISMAIVILLNGYISMDTAKRIILNIAPLLICFVFVDYFMRVQDKSKINTLLFCAILIIIVRSITAINAEIMSPNIARYSATGMYQDVPKFDLLGAGTYQFINGLVFLVVPLLYTIRHSASLRLKTILILVTALSLCAIVYTGWGAALILFVLLFFIGLSPKKKKYVPIYCCLVSGLLLVGLVSEFIFHPLESLFEDYATIYDKIIDMKESLLQGEASGQIEGRQLLYMRSFELFCENPIFGDINIKPGGHAFWLDHLASFGITGTLPLMLAYFLIVVKSSQLVPDNYRAYHYLNALVFLVFGCVKNIGGYEFIIFLCIIGPLLVHITNPNVNVMRIIVPAKDRKLTSSHSWQL